MCMSNLYLISMPCAEAAMPPAYMEQPLSGFGDVARDGVHILAAMSAYATWIALMVRQNRLHTIHRNRSPVFPDEGAHTCKPGTGIRQRMSFVSSKSGRQIMVGVQTTVWMLIAFVE